MRNQRKHNRDYIELVNMSPGQSQRESTFQVYTHQWRSGMCSRNNRLSNMTKVFWRKKEVGGLKV